MNLGGFCYQVLGPVVILLCFCKTLWECTWRVQNASSQNMFWLHCMLFLPCQKRFLVRDSPQSTMKSEDTDSEGGKAALSHVTYRTVPKGPLRAPLFTPLTRALNFCIIPAVRLQRLRAHILRCNLGASTNPNYGFCHHPSQTRSFSTIHKFFPFFNGNVMCFSRAAARKQKCFQCRCWA